MAEGSDKKKRLYEGVGASDFKRRRIREINFDDLCQEWERRPYASRPAVFFTVGDIVIPSSSSGVLDISSSLCRQFWTWLGQNPDDYEPSRIAFNMVHGQGLHMSLPDLKYFKVKLKHGPKAPLESVITLSRKNGNSQTLTAQTIMTQDYMATPFRTQAWSGGAPEVLIDIEATLKFPGDMSEVERAHMYIDTFYSKASDIDTGNWIQDGSEEEKQLRGSGRRLLCQMLDAVKWTHDVVLDACGISYRDKVFLTTQADLMEVQAILNDLEQNSMQALTDLKPNLFEEWNNHRIATRQRIRDMRRLYTPIQDKEKDAEENLASLRKHWILIQGNKNLVQYYMRTFGFKPVKVDDFTHVTMQASAEVIRAHCNQAAHNDRLW